MTFKKVDRILKKSGWTVIRVSGSHFQYGNADFSYVVTVPNHGSRDLSRCVVRNIEKGTGLSLR